MMYKYAEKHQSSSQHINQNFTVCKVIWNKYKRLLYFCSGELCIFKPHNFPVYLIPIFHWLWTVYKLQVIFKFIIYWKIVDLQYSVSFWCSAKGFSYIYVCILFFKFFSIMAYYNIQFPVLYNRTLLLTYSIYSSVPANPNLMICSSLPRPHYGNQRFVFNIYESVSVSLVNSFVPYFSFHI